MNPNQTPTLNFHIQTDAYQGPFELVLDLIAERKLLVNDLALANITEDFIAHVRSQESFPMDEAATFLQLAATLLLIKSKSLIPDLTLTDEESADIDDLKRRLEAYEKVREATRELARIFGKNPLFEAGERKTEPTFSPARDFTQENLRDALARLLQAKEAVEKLPETHVKSVVSIEEMMDRLTKRVQSALTLSFREFTGNAEERTEVIVSFLALLELIKQGSVAAEQHKETGEIHISHTAVNTVPRYG
jgi:segregation and condensation protein A